MVFNAPPTDVVLRAVGRLLYETSALTGELSDAQRGQLDAAQSIVRYLAVEECVKATLVSSLRQQALEILRAGDQTSLRDYVATLESAATIGDISEVLSRVLSELGHSGSHVVVIDQLHGVLRNVVEREVAAMAVAPR